MSRLYRMMSFIFPVPQTGVDECLSATRTDAADRAARAYAKVRCAALFQSRLLIDGRRHAAAFKED